MRRNYLKIILPTILTILLFILTIFLIIIPRFQESIMNGKREMIKELTNSAWSILAKYEDDEKEGLISREEAQNNAKSRIQYLRYGEENKDYFWITDMGPVMIMHPFREDLNGKDLNNFTDPHGKHLFVEFVETVKKSEHGYVDYMWQWKDDSLHIVPKLSYVRIFKPWNWVIGTGIYIEDVEKEISALTKRLLWITGGISVLIALLLIYISNQSLSIERKRVIAENELQESKERYKALVEAATEGLIMLSDGRISFSNNVIGKITGYDNSDLINRPVIELLSSNNNKDVIAAFSQNTVKEGQFELNLSKKNGGVAEVAVTSSVALFYGKRVNILIVKDVSIDRFQGYSNIDYHKLISTLNLGFFKARIDNSGKFVYANETALKIFGFESFKELSEINILRFLTDSNDLKELRKSLLADGFVKNKIIKIQNKNGFAIVSLSLVVLGEESNDFIICDGIIEDITAKENEREYYNKLITELKSNNFCMEMPVMEFVTPAFSIDTDDSVMRAIDTMTKRKTDTLLITKGNNEFIGIVTGNDVQKRVLQLNLNTGNPVYLIMSSPVIYSSPGISVGDALTFCSEKNISHLVIKDYNGNISGIFNTYDFYKKVTDSLLFFNNYVKNAETNEDILHSYKMLQILVKSLIKSDMSPGQVCRINSSFSDSVICRIVELAINKLGEPPVAFSFICMGSEGRMEESLLTDQDNAIIYDDVPKENEALVREYFYNMGQFVCDSLNFIGYRYCRGNIMAKNPQWNMPLSQWEKYFANWITTPEPQNLLDAIIFFDFRNVYGEPEFTEKIKKSIDILLSKQNVFLYHLAQNSYNTKIQQLQATEVIDLKGCLSHIVMFARTYSLQHNIWLTNTIERLNAVKSRQIVAASTVDEIIYVYNYLMKLRLKNQVNQIESSMPVTNLLNAKSLNELEYAVLKRVLGQISSFQNKIGLDFRLKA